MARKLPKGWNRVALGDVCEINPRADALKGVDKISFVAMADTSESGQLMAQTVVPVTKKAVTGYTRFRRGDILCAKITPCFENGKGALTDNLEMPQGIGSTEFHVIRTGDRILPEIAHAVVQSTRFRRRGELWMTGSAGQKRVPADYIAEYEMALPPLDEQRRIVRVLDAAKRLENASDDLYRKRRALAAAKFVEIAKAAGGDSIKLSDIVSINANALPDSTDPDREIQYFDVSSDGDHEVSGRMRFSQAPSRARRLAEVGDLVYATIRPLLRRLFVAEDRPDAVYSTGYAILSGPEDVTRYLYHALTTEPVERQIHAFSTGTGYPAISAGDLGDVKIRLPNKASRIAIANMADAMLKHADAHRQIAEVAGLRHRGLMQILLTGQKRLTCDLPGMAVTDG